MWKHSKELQKAGIALLLSVSMQNEPSNMLFQKYKEAVLMHN